MPTEDQTAHFIYRVVSKCAVNSYNNSNMSLPTQAYKGARDFYPDDKRLQKYLFSVMRAAVEKFGYEEYDAPIIEPLAIYQAKTSDEIVNEQTYAFTDRGGREVVLRPEMTPSVSRMVAAKRQELSYPLRWYSIPNLWRYERPQRGRMREHWQLNVDLFGVEGLEAEHELISLAATIMRTFGAKPETYKIRINNRQLLNEALHGYLGLSQVQAHTLSKLLDRRQKMDKAEFTAEADALLTPTQREAGTAGRLFDLLDVSSFEELPAELAAHHSVTELKRLLKLLADSGVANAVFDLTLVRGFDYYTGIVFEIFDVHPENNRSMFGGGRYDGLVALFGVEPVPTVGFGMGDVTLQNFLEMHNLLPTLKTEIELYVVLIGDIYEQAVKPVSELREMGLRVVVDLSGKKPDKQIKTAVKKGVHYVLFIGENELSSDQYMLKNLETGKEERHSLQRIVSIVKDYRDDSR